jgi:hypothetical protein
MLYKWALFFLALYKLARIASVEVKLTISQK